MAVINAENEQSANQPLIPAAHARRKANGYHGAPFSNLRHLRTLRLNVEVAEGDSSLLSSYLERGMPVIAAVETQYLPYWNRDVRGRTQSVRHAVVVVGIDGPTSAAESMVYVNDPAFDDAPQIVRLDWFHLAWIERDYQCAVIGNSVSR